MLQIDKTTILCYNNSMKFIGKDLKEVNKGYFGIRRCTICNNELRDVDLVELYATSYLFFIPIKSKIVKRLLVCKHCNAYMELSDDLWSFYSTYYNDRFNKSTTDNIVDTLTALSRETEQNGVKLNINDKACEASLDLIYQTLAEKYKVWQNVEEIIKESRYNHQY